jgi:hypothetical protein
MSAFVRRSFSGFRGYALAVLAPFLFGACSAPTKVATAEAFQNTKRLEAELRKGVSTTEDILRVLGEPTGHGAVLLPSVHSGPQEMWFYQDIELTDIKATQGQIDLIMRQQILVVFVRDRLFEGFMWFSNKDAATAWVKDSLRGKIR